jgi:hypothetical protein
VDELSYVILVFGPAFGNPAKALALFEIESKSSSV